MDIGFRALFLTAFSSSFHGFVDDSTNGLMMQLIIIMIIAII
jgi:hypothetical protein